MTKSSYGLRDSADSTSGGDAVHPWPIQRAGGGGGAGSFEPIDPPLRTPMIDVLQRCIKNDNIARGERRRQTELSFFPQRIYFASSLRAES